VDSRCSKKGINFLIVLLQVQSLFIAYGLDNDFRTSISYLHLRVQHD
jgi:hypothetical protein